LDWYINNFIGVVFATAAEKYHSVLTSEQQTKGANLTLDDLEDAMNRLWRQGYGSQKKHTSDDGGDIIWAAFGGTCYNCQEKGHRADQCPKKAGYTNGNRNAGGNTKIRFSWTRIRTSARITSVEETPSTDTLGSAMTAEKTMMDPSFLCMHF
jgi:hypothetical protein